MIIFFSFLPPAAVRAFFPWRIDDLEDPGSLLLLWGENGSVPESCLREKGCFQVGCCSLLLKKRKSGRLRFPYLPGAQAFLSLRPVPAHRVPCRGSPQPFPITTPKSAGWKGKALSHVSDLLLFLLPFNYSSVYQDIMV